MKLNVTVMMLFLGMSVHAEELNLDRILGLPMDVALAGAPQEERFAWVRYEQGRRNVLVTEGPEFKPRTLTNFEQDDGQQIRQLTLSSDGRWLAFLRGGRANPANLPQAPMFGLWLFDLTSGQEYQLPGMHSPKFSPASDRLLVQAGASPAVLELSEPGAEPQPLFRTQGGLGGISWSPDGKKIVFTSDRGRYRLVGVYDMAEARITWLSPGVDRDMTPAWSPSADRVAFARLPGVRSDERPNSTSGYPLSIIVADVKTGDGAEVWRGSGLRDGGAAQSFGLPMAWIDDDTLAFQSEHDGRMRLHRLDLKSTEIRPLFGGDCELVDSAVAFHGDTFYVATTCGARDGHVIWKLAASGKGRPERLTPLDAIAVDPVVSGGAGQLLAYRSSQGTGPISVTITNSSGEMIADTIKPVAMTLVEPQAVSIRAEDGLEIPAQLFVDPSQDQSPKPAVIFYHGGPNRQMLTGWHPVRFYSNTYAFNQFLASRGYVVLSLNFRASTGYGRDFRLAENQGPEGASEYQDAVAAAKYLAERDDVDKNRIAAYGASYGGVMTAMSLARNSDLFAAGVAINGVYDWWFREREFPSYQKWHSGDPFVSNPKAAEMAYQSSAVSALSGWTSPVLLIHGDDDEAVMFAQTIDLAQRLRGQGTAVETLVLPGEVHDFLLHQSTLRIYRQTFEFFERQLRNAK